MLKATVIFFLVQFLFSLSSFATVCSKMSLDEANAYLDLKPHLKTNFVDAFTDPGLLVDLKPHMKNQADPGLLVNLKPSTVYYRDFNFYVCSVNKKGWNYDIASDQQPEDGRGTVLIKAEWELGYENDQPEDGRGTVL